MRITSNDAFARSWLLLKQDSSLLRNPVQGELLEPSPPGVFAAYLLPGSYTVSVGCHGYEDRSFPNVLVVDGRQTGLDVALKGAD